MPQILGKEVGSIGYGLMGLTIHGHKVPTSTAISCMKTALDSGSNLWNGGEFYGPPTHNSLHIANAYFTQYPEDADKVLLSIKGCVLPPPTMAPDCSPENVRRSINECLRILDGKKKLDIFECARVDPDVPIEKSIEAIADFVKAGLVGGISLSEVGAESIRRANKVHPIAFVEVELSLYSTEILTNGVLATCGELGIPILAYSPLGRGFLTGAFRKYDDVPKDSWLLRLPRYQPEVFDENVKLALEVEEIAKKKGVAISQVAVAWVRQQGGRDGLPDIIPIPGGSTVDHVIANAVSITISEEEIAALDAIWKRIEVKGGRYPAGMEKYLHG